METKQKLPPWLITLGLAVILFSHTQLTVRHIALRVAGVQFGEAHQVMSVAQYLDQKARFDRERIQPPSSEKLGRTAIIQDLMGVYLPGKLKGKRVHFKERSFEILDNTATHILVLGSRAELRNITTDSSHYETGYDEPGLLVRLAQKVPSVNFTPADMLLGLFFLLLTIHYVRTREPLQSWLPSWEAIALLFFCALSLIPKLRLFDDSLFEPSIKSGIKELAQYVEVFVVAWFAFRELFRDKQARCWYTLTIIACSGAVIILGLLEYTAVFKGYTLRGLLDVESIDSVFGICYNPTRAWATGSESNKNVLASYLVLVLPILFATFPAPERRLTRILIIALGCLGVGLILHAWMLVSAAAGITAVAMFCPKRWSTVGSFGLIAVAVLVFCLVNRHHGTVLADSVALHREKDVYGLLPMPMKGTSLGGRQAWQQKYVERQVSLNALGFSPISGLGIGNYQAAINQFYMNAKVDGHAIEKTAKNLMEGNSHSLYLVQAVETGALGTIAFLVLLLCSIKRAIHARAICEDKWDRALLAGVLGSLVGMVLLGFGGSFLVRGVQLIGIAMMALPFAMPIDQSAVSVAAASSAENRPGSGTISGSEDSSTAGVPFIGESASDSDSKSST